MKLPENFRILVLTTTETDADVQDYACGGGLDIGLTENGIALATKIAKRFKKNPFKLKRIVASPELRTVQMADIVHDQMKVRLSLHPDLKDQNLGSLEGKAKIAVHEIQNAPSLGESAATFSDRILKALLEVHALQENVLLVTHPRVQAFLLSCLGLEKEKIERASWLNCINPWVAAAGRFIFRKELYSFR